MKKQEPFLSGYRFMSIPAFNAAGESAWPEAFPPERLDAMREAVGERQFLAQMMLCFKGAEGTRLNPGLIRFYADELDPKTARLGDARITGRAIYWDPSCGRAGGDASVIVLILCDALSRRAFIHDCLYLPARETDADDSSDAPLGSQCAEALRFMRAHGTKTISVEINGIGNAFPEILRKEAEQIGAGIFVHRVANRENKTARILDAIEPLLDTGRLYAHERIKRTDLIGEMDDWSPGGWTKDDGLDALAGALAMRPIPIRPRGARVGVISARTEFKIQ